MKAASLEQRVARILEALGQELIEASDEEILEAAKELGMDPQMQGSAAFAGLKHPAQHTWEEFFGADRETYLQLVRERKTLDGE